MTDDVSFTGAVDLDAAGLITVTGGSAAGDDISFTSTIDGTQSLTLVAGLGAVNLQGNAGTTTPLNLFTVTSAAQADLANVRANNIAVSATNIDLNGTLYTALTDDLSFTGAVDLDAAGLITVTGGSAAGDDISFTSTIDGTQAFTLTAGTGTITFSGIIGTSSASAVRPSALTIASASLVTFSDNIFIDGDIEVRSTDLDISNVALTDFDVEPGRTIRFYTRTGTETMGIGGAIADWTISDAELAKVKRAASLIFGEAGVQSGSITIQTVESPVPAAAIEFNSDSGAGSVVLDDSGSATAFATNGTGAITIRAGTSGILAAQAAYNTYAELSTTGAIDLQSAGVIALADSIGGADSVGGPIIPASLAVTSTGATSLRGQNYRSTGNQTWTAGNLSLLDNPKIFQVDGAANVLTFAASTNSADQNVTIRTDNINLNNNLNLGTGNLYLYTRTPAARDIVLGAPDAGTALTLTDAELARLGPVSIGALVVGESGQQAGDVIFTSADLAGLNGGAAVSVTVNSNAVGGVVRFESDVFADSLSLGSHELSVYAYDIIEAAQVPSGRNDIVTSGIINLNTDGAAGVRIGQGPVAASPYTGYYPIVIAAGHAEVNVSGNNSAGVYLMGNGANVVIGTIAISGPLYTDLYNSTGFIYLTKDIDTNGQSVNFIQAVRLRPDIGNLITITSSGGNVSFQQTLDEDDAGGVAAGTNSLTIHAGTGTIVFTGAVGRHAVTPKPFRNLDLTGAAVTISGSLTTENGGSLSITHSGVLTIADIDGPADIANFDIDLDGSFTSTGSGSVQIAGDIRTNNQAMQFDRPITLNGSLQLSTNTLAGNIVFGNTVALNTFAMSVAAGTGTVAFNGPVSATADTGYIRLLSASGLTSSGTINAPTVDFYIDANGSSITLGSNLTCRNFYFYRGSLNPASRTIRTNLDFAIFGTSYDPDDADFNGVDTRFEYYDLGSLAYYPGSFVTYANAAFANLTGTTIQVDADSNGFGNFYVNGANMNSGAWSLVLPDNSTSTPVYNPTAAATTNQWGAPYAVAFNMAVADSTASGGVVAAAIPGVAPDAGTHHSVTDSGSNTNWNFVAPRLMAVRTMYDNVLELTFDQPIENSNNEIATIIGSILLDNGAAAFTGAFAFDGLGNYIPTGTTDRSVFYIQTTNATWNTDATGVSSGAALSTDRWGNAQSVIPDLTIPLGLLRAAGGKAFVRNYGSTVAANTVVYDGTIAGTAFTDACRPVLISAELGTAPHEADTWVSVRPDDAHHYIQLRWSEPVNLGSDPAFQIGAATPALNANSAADFSVPAQPGGQVNGSSVAGYFSAVTGSVISGTRDAGQAATDEIHGLYREVIVAGNTYNQYGDHGLYISLAGWSFVNGGNERFWPGYLDTANSLAGLINVPVNNNIEDAVGNSVESTANTEDPGNYGSAYPKADISISGTPWESALSAADFELDTAVESLAGSYDIIPLDRSPADSYIDRFEIRTTRAVRDSSLTYPADNLSELTTLSAGFVFRDEIAEAVYRYGGSVFDTTAYARPFCAAPDYLSVSEANDNLVTLALGAGDQNNFWTARSKILFEYSANSGFVSDIHGYRLASVNGACADKTPPAIRFTTGIVGSDQLYVIMSKGIYNYSAFGLQPSDFIFENSGSIVVQDIAILSDIGGLAYEMLLTLNQPINPGFALNARLGLSSQVEDAVSNFASGVAERRAVDLAQVANAAAGFPGGLLSVLGASDGVHTGDPMQSEGALAAGALGLLRLFDNSGRMYARDTTVYTAMSFGGGASSALPLVLYYDVAPPEDTSAAFPLTGRSTELAAFWLPSILPGFNLKANAEARSVSPFYVSRPDGISRNFTIPSSDPEIAGGVSVSFLFRYGQLWIARATDTAAPQNFDLWRYRVEDVIKQRGGVTILNNVIDSTRNERTALQLELVEAGQVSVLVFTLDGDIVKALHRGRLAAGNYTMTWDGTNTAGNPVVRGMYFVRVVAPGIDEIRKVMVVKD
ncbi:MAG: hypothetical protein KKI09_15865 [Spirochaetes bacterium]|nr:hypothetical protein [Spirochaetota bacterium]